MKKIISTLTAGLLALPITAFASDTLNDLNDVADASIYYINLALYVLMAVAVLVFVWYVIKYFILSADAANRKEAGMYVLYSILGFFVVLSIWGLVNIFKGTFRFSNDRAPRSNEIQNLFPKP